MTLAPLVREEVVLRVGERIEHVLNEEFGLATMAGKNEKASIMAGMLTALITLIEAGGPSRPGALREVERAARVCLLELIMVSDALGGKE